MRRTTLIAALCCSLAGCSPRVPETPIAARSQAPAAGAPAAPWRALGRLEIAFPGTRFSVDCHLRGLGDGQVRAVLVGDGGVQLADLSTGPGGVTVHQAIDDLRRALPLVARLVGEAYGVHPAGAGRWRDGRWTVRSGPLTRWYGGDPLLLRRVEGGGWPVFLADYRAVGDGLLAREALADGPWGAELRLRLGTAQALPAP